jgi:hypothetical protein
MVVVPGDVILEATPSMRLSSFFLDYTRSCTIGSDTIVQLIKVLVIVFLAMHQFPMALNERVTRTASFSLTRWLSVVVTLVGVWLAIYAYSRLSVE